MLWLLIAFFVIMCLVGIAFAAAGKLDSHAKAVENELGDIVFPKKRIKK